MRTLSFSTLGTTRQSNPPPIPNKPNQTKKGIQKLVPGSEHIDNPSAPEPGQVLIQAAYNLKVIQLAFLVACLYTGVGVLRLGWLINFLSHSVITGFTSGAAIIIALSQVHRSGGGGCRESFGGGRGSAGAPSPPL
jgi:sulfate transporter 4